MNQWISGNCGWQVVVSFSAWWAFTLTPFQWKTTITTRKKKSKLCFDFSVISDFIFARHVSIIQWQIADHLYLKQTLCLEHILWLCWRVPDENIFEILELHSAFSGSWRWRCYSNSVTLNIFSRGDLHTDICFDFSGHVADSVAVFFQFTGVSSCLVVKQKHH